ncbi:TonB-dependent receptor domain-containing protein [Aquimonas sp.]|jgi:iron complex outermembrane receptor protein|uniref:TonB-dependent receptor domain-containing protein n=1 Tax=Aquimonas sp. TaxID=1872588 RepID=UPI0037BFF4E4
MTLRPLAATIALLLPGLSPAQSAAPHDTDRAKQLDQLIVTATPLRSNAENIVQPVEILAGEALDDHRAGTLGETVSQLLGVQSSFFGAGVGRPIIRGQEGPRVQVLSEGIASLDASTTSVDHAVSIEPFLADQIEVLKGPATLLYGPGAIGGAVNVVDGRIPTALPEQAVSGRAEVRGGSVADERSAMFRLDGANGQFAWHVDGFRRDTSDYEIPGFARVEDDHDHEEEGHEAHEEEENPFGLLPNSAVDSRGGALGLSWIGARGYAGVSVSRFETVYGVPGHNHGHEEEHEDGEQHEEEGEAPVSIDLAQTRYDFKAGLSAPFAGVESMNFRLGVNNYRHVELEGEEVGTRFDNEAYEGRADLVHAPLAGWRGAVGLQFSRRDFVALGEEAFVPPSLSRDLGLFLIEEKDLDAWKFELGARADRLRVSADGHRERSFSSFSASAGALWRMSDALHFSASFDRAQRAPGAEELFSNGPHAATRSFEIGDDTLGRETANQLELAAHLHAGPLSGKLAAFQNRFDDFIYLANTGEEEDELPVQQWTQADARFHGLEAEAALLLADNASGAWTMRLSGDRVNASLDAGGNLPRIAPSRIGAGFDWSLDGWRASLDAKRYGRQSKVAEFEDPSEGFTLFDANLAYHWDVREIGWEVFLRGTNLSNREARLHTSVLKNDAPLPGRNLLFGVRAFF